MTVPRRIRQILILLLLISGLCFPLTVRAEVEEDLQNVASILWENPETGFHVLLEDDAQLLNPEERARLAEEMQQITAYGNVAFKSISYNSYSASYYACEFYYDTFGLSSGTLFLIDMDNREIYIYSDGAVYKTITDSYANTITDNVYRYASQEEYYTCASEAYQQIHALLEGRKIAQPMKYISNALLALILAALINYFLAKQLSGSAKPSSSEVLSAISTKYALSNPRIRQTGQSKVYCPSSSSGHSSGGSHRSGSHRSSSHRSSSHRSGGGGGHRF